jgi:transcriptional regulator with XRE-family HTH domain
MGMQVEKLQLGAYLKGVRESLQLSMHELERRARASQGSKSITAGQLSRIENGKTDPGFTTLQKIAELLDLPLVLILDGSKGRTESATIVSTDRFARVLPEALQREKLLQLLVCCMEFSDEHLHAMLEVAHVLQHVSRPVRSTDSD